MFQKPRLQGQLESIEQAANAYFETEAASGHPENFNSLEPRDRKRCSELQRGVSNVVRELLGAIADSPLFDEPDQQTLRDGGRRADAALRFHSYRRWTSFVDHDEGKVLRVGGAGQAEDPIFSVSHAREEFNEGLAVVGRFLIRIPDQTHGETEEASVVDTKSEDWKRKLESKASFTIVEAADIANETERSLRNKTDKPGRPGPLKLNSQGRIIADSLKAYLLDER